MIFGLDWNVVRFSSEGGRESGQEILTCSSRRVGGLELVTGFRDDGYGWRRTLELDFKAVFRGIVAFWGATVGGGGLNVNLKGSEVPTFNRYEFELTEMTS